MLSVLVSAVARTVESGLLLLVVSSLSRNFWELRLALKWASWDANLTIHTPLELSRLTKGYV